MSFKPKFPKKQKVVYKLPSDENDDFYAEEAENSHYNWSESKASSNIDYKTADDFFEEMDALEREKESIFDLKKVKTMGLVNEEGTRIVIQSGDMNPRDDCSSGSSSLEDKRKLYNSSESSSE